MAHQSIQSIRVIEGLDDVPEVEVQISLREFLANWHCASVLADKEGMKGVAERLRYDVDVLERYAKGFEIRIRIN